LKVCSFIPFEKAQQDIKSDNVVLPLSVAGEDITKGFY